MNRFDDEPDRRDALLEAEVNLCEAERLVRTTALMLRKIADPETKQRLYRAERELNAVRLSVPETFAALAAA